MILIRLYILIGLILATLAAAFTITATIQGRIEGEIVKQVHSTAYETVGKGAIQREDVMLQMLANSLAHRTEEDMKSGIQRFMKPLEMLQFKGNTHLISNVRGEILYCHSTESPDICVEKSSDGHMELINRFEELKKNGGGHAFTGFSKDGMPGKFIYVTRINDTGLWSCIVINITPIIRDLEEIFTPLAQLNTLFRRVVFGIIVTLFVFILLSSVYTIRQISRLEKERRERTEKLKETNVLLEVEVNIRKRIEEELKEANRDLKLLSSRDGLTGLANRRFFDDYIKTEWERMARERKPLSILLCDVDHFKKYNDTYGHLEGDSCLKAIASAIGNACRRPADLPARYGGEEFIVTLPDTGKQGALRVAEAIRATVARLHIEHRESGEGFVTLSVGSATAVPSPDTEYPSLIKKADAALYRAKGQGRNRVEGYFGHSRTSDC